MVDHIDVYIANKGAIKVLKFYEIKIYIYKIKPGNAINNMKQVI